MTDLDLHFTQLLLDEALQAIDYWSLIAEDPTRSPGEIASATGHLRYFRQMASRRRDQLLRLNQKLEERDGRPDRGAAGQPQ